MTSTSLNSIWIGFLICLKQAEATVCDLWKLVKLFCSIILLKWSILSPTEYSSILFSALCCSSLSSKSSKLCSCSFKSLVCWLVEPNESDETDEVDEIDEIFSKSDSLFVSFVLCSSNSYKQKQKKLIIVFIQLKSISKQ